MLAVRIMTAMIVAVSVGATVFIAPTTLAQRAVMHCDDFASQQEAHVAFVSSNYADKELDPDGNGIACDDQDYVFRDNFLTPVTPAGTSPDGVPPAAAHAAIYAGDCTPGPFTNPVAQLNDPWLPTGDSIGVAPSPSVASSYSTAQVTLDTLTQTGHVLTIFDPHQPDRLLACGEIGGVMAPSGYLAVALAPSKGSEVFGIAYLSPRDDNRLGVSLFVTAPT